MPPLKKTQTTNKKSVLKKIPKISKRRKKVRGKKSNLFLALRNFSFVPKLQKKKNSKIKIIFLTIILASIVVSGILAALILKDLPSPQSLNSPDSFAVSTQILDRNGKLLYEIYADQNRTPIKIADLPPYVYQASIAIEDKGFYKHFGFDFLGMIRALKNTLLQQSLQGGSTITQQLVKNALLTRDRTIQRKIKEAVLTIATEVLYSKDEILEMYLNHIPYGGTAYGIEAASRLYFDKSAKDLTINEAALLAGLPQAPSRYSPFQSDPKISRNRQADVLRRMVEDDYISQTQADEAGQQELHFALSQTDIRAPHFVFYVKDLLVKKYGLEKVESGGLRVKTSLNIDLQEVAQASLSAEVEGLKKLKVGNGAALITKPNTGEILAMIGSKDYFDATEDGQVNVTIEERQPGSSFKPLNLAIAFEQKKLTPGSMLLDIPTCFGQVIGKSYCPKNYDYSFHGPVQQRFALGNSYNIPAVKVTAINGIQTVIDYGSKMGISTFRDPSQYGISLGLGAAEVKMVDFAQAYGVLANQGIKVPLVPILEVVDYQGNILERVDVEQRKKTLEEMSENEDITLQDDLSRVLHRAPAYLVSHILLDNNARVGAFGSNSQLVIKDQIVSAKTGTTNNLRDNWTVGFTPEFLVMTWVGNNDNTPMNQYLVSGVTGAAPIWHDIMTWVLKGQESVWPEKPTDVINKSICSLSGLLPNPESPCPTRTEFFWEGTEPTQIENISKEVWIDPTTGLPPKTGESWEGLDLQLQRHTLLSDPFTQDYCLDCPRPVNEEGKIQYEQNLIPMTKLIEISEGQPIGEEKEIDLFANPGE